MRKDQSQRAAALEREREADELRATLIEYNLTQVDAVLAASGPDSTRRFDAMSAI